MGIKLFFRLLQNNSNDWSAWPSTRDEWMRPIRVGAATTGGVYHIVEDMTKFHISLILPREAEAAAVGILSDSFPFHYFFSFTTIYFITPFCNTFV